MTNRGVPFMKSATSELVDDVLDLLGVAHGPVAPFRLDPQLVDAAVGQRLVERLVDELVLLDERQAVEARRGHAHLEVVAAARAVDDVDLGRVRERAARAASEASPCSRGDRTAIGAGEPLG